MPAVSLDGPAGKLPAVAPDTLSLRAVNRALLARQLLLERARRPAAAAIEHLVGLQAQVPVDPYVGLWSRLEGFDPAELSDLLTARDAVRATLMRATIHLVSARDCLFLRPLMQPVPERTFKGQFGRKVDGVDRGALLAAGRALVEERPRTRAELRNELSARWPDHDAEALALAVTFMVPLVQVTPRGLWRRSGQATWTTIEAWLGRPLEKQPSLDELVLRYLAAFGPATAMDVQAWCGLTRLREVTERLRPRLRAFRSEDGRELLDLPDAPRPDPDTPAPVRFLPEFDNLALGHADRSHVVPGGPDYVPAAGRGGWRGSLLVDGMVAALWRLTLDGGAAKLRIETYARVAKSDEGGAIEAEGDRLIDFLAPEAAAREIELVPR
jgi:winged helix DNA-binding protein